MKKLLVVSALAALGFTSVGFAGGISSENTLLETAPAAISSASETGVYVGLSGGLASTNWKNNIVSSANSKVEKDQGVAGRAFAGYDINRYFAAEVGYTYFFNKVDFSNKGYDQKTQTVDAYLKGKLPVVENFDLFAKLGAGWIFTKWTNPVGATNYNSSTNNINVAFGAGMDYSITENIIASAEWLRIAGCQLADTTNTNKYIPNTDTFMIGLRYRFDM